jgi:hypothetical protein
MIDLRLLTCVASAGLLALLPADPATATRATQPAAAADQAPATRAPSSQDPTAQDPAAKASRSTASWIEQLGAEDFRDRVAAERALRELGNAALPELRKAAEAADNGEVQWRARRLVRQIERGEAGAGLQKKPGTGDAPTVELRPAEPRQSLPGQDPAAPGRRPADDRQDDPFAEMQRRFDAMFGEIERDFGVAVPRRSFFGDDFFRDLQDQMQRAQGGTGSSQSMNLQVGPDGAVKVEVQSRNADGEVETKTYEAPSMAEFQRQYPGVLNLQGRFGGTPGWSMGLSPRLQWRQVQPGARQPVIEIEPDLFQAAPQPSNDPATTAQALARGELLGVQVRESIGDELREYLGLDPEQGLLVEAVSGGSLAERLGLQRLDIVLQVAGQPIASPADVRQALAGVAAGGKVEVEIVRQGQRQVVSAQKPANVESGAKAEATTRGKLEKRSDKAGGELR